MNKNIAFLGTPLFAVPILKVLNLHGYNISCVFTQPPKKSFRGQKINKSPIQTLAENLAITVKTPNNIENEYNYIKDLNLDLAIVVAYGQIIPKNVLGLSKNGFVNIHASLLPTWRGAAPIQRSIMNMDKDTGISVMKINENLDEGPIINSYKINIIENENALQLSKRLSILGEKIIIQNVEDIFNSKAKFKEQDHKKATYAKKIIKKEGEINWKDDSKKILAKINGLYPRPGAWFYFKKKRYKILEANFSEKSGMPGEVLDNNLTISCGISSIKILEIQKEGKNPQKTRDFLLGNKIRKGTFLIDE